MTTNTPGPIRELVFDQQKEIERHKWFLSEKHGVDVGWSHASQDWFNNHFAGWILEQRRLIDRALRVRSMKSTERNRPKAKELQTA